MSTRFVDAVELHPVARAVRDAAVQGRRDEVVGQLRGLEAPERGYVMRAVAESHERLQLGPLDLESDDGRLLAVLFAHVACTKAWDERGGASAESTSKERFERFRQGLIVAEGVLIDVVARDPDLVDAWDLRIRTSMGLELGLSESRRRHRRLDALQPDHFPAHRDLLQVLSPRWFGDWDQQLGWARERAATSEDGSLGPALVALTHVEGWVEHGPDHLRRADVIDEVIESSQRSVMHPSFSSSYGGREVHAALALLFSVAERPVHADVHFRALGTQPVQTVWAYFDDPGATYEKYRRAAEAVGDRR